MPSVIAGEPIRGGHGSDSDHDVISMQTGSVVQDDVYSIVCGAAAFALVYRAVGDESDTGRDVALSECLGHLLAEDTKTGCCLRFDHRDADVLGDGCSGDLGADEPAANKDELTAGRKSAGGGNTMPPPTWASPFRTFRTCSL